MISIIIPTLNEEKYLKGLLQFLIHSKDFSQLEIIVVDGGSIDRTREIASSFPVKLILSSNKGRAAQLNLGAKKARYNVLYFIHADTLPPESFAMDIIDAVKNGFQIGRYRTKFIGRRFLLRINEFFTRFDWFICFGGDQSLFITKEVFQKIDGFNENFLIMEEYDLVQRAREFATYKIISKNVLVSMRKYYTNTWIKVQWVNWKTIRLFKKGAPQEEIVQWYRNALSESK